ncbi:MAG TPA: hypothetical protein VFR58_15150 [Flavisolibacter sp.]|nr:hypothetical protein [Flavisolibacter sp.]
MNETLNPNPEPMTVYILTAIVTVAVAAFIFFPREYLSSPPSGLLLNRLEHRFLHPEDAALIVSRLQQMDYYSYAASSDIPKLSADLTHSLSMFGVLSSIENEQTGIPLDFRYYSLDGEALCERGGFREKLSQMQPFFKKAGLQFALSNYRELRSAGRMDLSFCINDREYKVFQGYDGKDGWSIAALRLAEIINCELTLQDKEERMYLINSGNDGAAVFLTPQQYGLINAELKDELWKPLKPGEWRRLNKVQGALKVEC